MHDNHLRDTLCEQPRVTAVVQTGWFMWCVPLPGHQLSPTPQVPKGTESREGDIIGMILIL